VRSVLGTLGGEALRRVVFDLRAVTFMDLAALTTILHADQRGHREDFDVVVVRPPSPASRILILTRAGEHLTILSHPREAGVNDEPVTDPIEFRRLDIEEVSTCARCRSNPAVIEARQLVGGLATLDSPDGPICGGCVTWQEQVELGEAILRDLRLQQPRDEAKVRSLAEALTELRESRPAD
jgi:anti-anti-sigma regulatory factor